MLPCTTSEFFAVFASYNEAMWPLQLVAAALGVAVVALLLSRPAWSHRAITAIIGAFWLLMGLGYHWSFFTVINNAAYALIPYPVIGLAGAHAYPETPLFGVAPWPTTIFTLAVLMVAHHPRPLLVAPSRCSGA